MTHIAQVYSVPPCPVVVQFPAASPLDIPPFPIAATMVDEVCLGETIFQVGVVAWGGIRMLVPIAWVRSAES